MVNKIIFYISFGIFTLLSILGFITVMTLAHELSHYNDFHKYALPGSEKICLEFSGNSAAFYTSDYDFDRVPLDDKFLELKKWTEIKAYTVSTILAILYIVLMVYIFKKVIGER